MKAEVMEVDKTTEGGCIWPENRAKDEVLGGSSHLRGLRVAEHKALVCYQ